MSVYIPEGTRAREVWRAIEGKPFLVIFRTPGGLKLDPQVVRIEYDPVNRKEVDESGLGWGRRVGVFGVRNHPSQPDTDIQQGYRFIYEGREYTINDLFFMPGEIQARGEAVS
jgi:hypothetical protein